MSALDLKLVRDLWRLRGQVLAIALVISAAAATFILAMSAHASLTRTLDRYYAEEHFADLFADMTRAPRSVVERIAALDGVARAEGRIRQYATLDLPQRVEPVSAVLNSVGPEGESELNRLVIKTGRAPREGRAEEVVVGTRFAEANDLGPGDTLDAVIYGTRQRLRVVGTGLAPDYIWAIAPGQLIPDEERFGIMWMGRDALEAATDRVEAVNSLAITLAHGAEEAEVIRQIDRILAPYGGTGAYARADHPSHEFVDNDLMQLEATTLAVPPIFLLVSTFLVYIVLGRLIHTERQQIGILKAFGFSTGDIAGHYLKFAVAIALIGVALGTALGSWMGREITELYGRYYNFPFLDYVLPPHVFAAAAALAFGSALLGAYGGVRSAAQLAPAEAMSPPPPPIYRRGPFERLGEAMGLSSGGNMIVRHIARWPGRSAVTVVGVGLSLALLFTSLQFQDSTRAMLDDFFFRAQKEDITVSFTEPRTASAAYYLLRLPGVQRAEISRAVPVRLRNGALTERTAIEGSEPGGMLGGRIDQSGASVPLPERGLLISRQLASKLDLAAGDQVEAEMLGGRRTRMQLPINAVIDELVGARAYASLDTVERLSRDNSPAGSARLLIDENQRTAFLRRLKQVPAILGVTEKWRAVEKFEQMAEENIITMVGFYVAFASAIVVGVVYNSARILFSERAHELATLRVLGYHRREVLTIMLGEIALLVVVALPVGCLLGYFLARLVTAMISSDLFRLPFAPLPATYGISAIIVMVAAALTAMVVARRIYGLDMVRVLKARD